MNARKFAHYGGILFFAMGLISLIPAFDGSRQNLIPLDVDLSYARFLGIFPMNVFNKAALIVFGIGGIMAAQDRDLHTSIQYARAVCLAMVPLAILGLFPATQTLGGYWPLYGSEALAHGIFGLIGGYFGFVQHSKRAGMGPLER